ncbi:MAG: HAMP domain-containing histidine kinase [Candidatus Cloacimonetes bacterium]|nr:HAMP domain-containing histidine kinase [Candidatus Cloacimonadota bacterium]
MIERFLDKSILETILNESSVTNIGVISLSGELLYLNKGMVRIINCNNHSSCIINPSFEEFKKKSEDVEDGLIYTGLITIGNPHKNNQSYQSKVYKAGDSLIFVAEYIVDELISFANQISDINREVTNLQRNLIKEKKELNKAMHILEKLNQEKNELLGIAAHDLRNPIGAIKSFSELILEDKDYTVADDLKDIIKMIHKSSDYMLYLITNLLDISTIEAGKLTLSIKEWDYLELVRESFNINRHYASTKKIKLFLDITNESLLIKIDHNKIMQVLNNLIGNAIKYSPENTEVIVRISETSNSIKTEIVDQGVGIAGNELNLLFKVFSKTSSKPTGNEVSTGLGLAISKRIIEGHDGTIGVESKIGEGSTFWFILPSN